MKAGLRTGTLAAALAVASGLAQAEPAAAQARLLCEVVYLPARSVWHRAVDIFHDERRVTEVRVDGVPVYSFAVRGTLILTALDNERIRIDVAGQTWTSDFRGMASGQGRCERGT